MMKFLAFIVLCFVTETTLVFAADDVADLKQYLLGTGDMIRIQVYNEQDLYLETRVSDTGSISYPFLGELKVQGLSLASLEELIISGLKGDYLINPKVSIDMMEYRQFYINGEVASAGGFAYQPGLTVRKAISLAGGFSERASKDKIFVIHDDSRTGDPIKITLEAVVRPGDIITVEQSFF
ncbi:MAG: polysaccharide export protein [Gammaproteobacteria bacterium]|nr:polysaccharide export protein [Gammaproteobacteria bacterium]